MASDGQVVVAAARWADQAFYLKEFANKYEFPAVVKIIKGQYGGLGVPTLPNPGLQSTALLVSAGRRNKIVAQAIKVKEGRRLMGIGPRIAIPDTYPGYFEILSEEGRAVRCIESVLELAKRRPEGACLVREPVRALLAKPDNPLSPDGARILTVGEMIFPAAELHLPGYKTRFLQCLDSRGDILLLGLDQRGKFSTLAKEDNISGVHTAKNLLTKRMPLTVRLVHGPPPRGLKSSGHFVPEMRLLTTFQEEHVFALPLQKDTGAVVALPLAAPIKLQTTRNTEQIKILKEFLRLTEKCSRSVSEVADRAYVLDGKVGDPKLLRAANQGVAAKTGYFLRRSASSDSQAPLVGQYYGNENRVPQAEGDEYDEIDQIYDYVRGFAPLPKSVRAPFPEPASPTTEQRSRSPSCEDRTKPEPPPIETIPGKKLQSVSTKAEKRTRKDVNPEGVAAHNDKNAVSSMFVKNVSTQRGRILRQKSSSPMKERSPSLGKKGSPVFGMRYKSLSNLQQAMELDGTLDSSHSGGRTSGDSGAGAKLPEKRSRRLSRPLSLTNLVWELRREPCRPAELEAHRRNSSSQKLAFGHQSKRIGTLYL